MDLYYLHFWDNTTPLDEIMRGLDDLVRQGKVTYIAISDTPAWQISRANMLADLRGWAPFIGIQIEYSLVERSPERDLLPMAQELDLGVTAWSPLAGGILSGKYLKPDSGGRNQNQPISERRLAIARLVVEIAGEIGCSPSQVALAWLRQQTTWGAVNPILGARTLDAGQLQRLDAANAIELGFPHAMLRSEMVANLTTGNQPGQLDNHRAPR
ncbi:MAG: aldo/keto reductase [Burkholderiales bacterium]|nr:aldo/keto reductase [Burkholderiales bacterium]